jgi:hypothetical protein
MEVRGSSNILKVDIERCEMRRSAGGFYFAFSSTFVKGGFLDGCLHFTREPPTPATPAP